MQLSLQCAMQNMAETQVNLVWRKGTALVPVTEEDMNESEQGLGSTRGSGLSLAQVTCCHPMPGAVNLNLHPMWDLHCHCVSGPSLGSQSAPEVRSQGHLSQTWSPRSRTEAGV